MSRNRRAEGGREVVPGLLEMLTRPSSVDPEEGILQRRFGLRLVALVVVLAGHVWVADRVRQLGYRVEALGAVIHQLDKERAEIEKELAAASGPSHVPVRALERGMQRPGNGQLRHLDAKEKL
jgi:hypothetical protein